MKRQDLARMKSVMSQIWGEKFPVKFTYALAKNERIITAVLDETNKLLQPPEGYSEWEKQRLELCREMAVKDDDGNPKMQNNNFVIEDMDEFDKKIEELKKKHPVVDEFEANRKKHAEKMNEEIEDPGLHKVQNEDLPEEMSPKVFQALMPMIVG
ncbi:MAG: hypothetical protein SVK08_00355 [Halobacteriota archaeon]|nr:hypothetical protein [Halobacteriota archaeon]